MKRGQKPKPIGMKVIEGNPGKRRIPTVLTVPEGPGPEIPPHLDGYAVEEWNRVSDGLKRMGVFTQIDLQAFSAYCSAYSRWRHAEEELAELRKKGGEIAALVHKTKSGNWIQQPLIGIANKAAADMVKYASEFGMTPSARARLSADVEMQKDSKFKGLIGVVGKDDRMGK